MLCVHAVRVFLADTQTWHDTGWKRQPRLQKGDFIVASMRRYDFFFVCVCVSGVMFKRPVEQSHLDFFISGFKRAQRFKHRSHTTACHSLQSSTFYRESGHTLKVWSQRWVIRTIRSSFTHCSASCFLASSHGPPEPREPHLRSAGSRQALLYICIAVS